MSAERPIAWLRHSRSVEQWARGHEPGPQGAHDYDLADDGLTPERVREWCLDYLATYDATA